MCQPKNWWKGLLPLALLWLLAGWVSTGKIEADIGERATLALKGMPLDKLGVSVQGRDVIVSGTAFDAADPAKAAIAAASLNGVRYAVDGTALAPEAKPFAWSVARDGAKVTLAGNVPSPEGRAAFNAAAKKAFVGAEIADTMTYARGAPACLNAASALGFNTLSTLSKGSVSLADTAIKVAGEAADFAGYDSALAALKTAPAGCTVAGAQAILPPEIKPYTWSAAHVGNTVSLTGYVPDVATRTALATAAKAALPGAEVVDLTRIARGAPAALVAGATFGLGQLGKLGDGSASLTDSALALSGEASSPANFAALALAATQVPAGVNFTAPAVRAAEVTPFAWSATRTAEGVALSGYAPSAGAKERILAAANAAFPGLTVTDRMLVARGAPAGIEVATGFALAELAKIASGTISIRDTAVAVSGEAANAADWKVAVAGLAAVPAGFTLIEGSVLPPMVEVPTWSATRTGNSVTLAGSVASLEQQAAIADVAKLAMPGVEVIDQMQVARGTNGDLEAVASYGLDELARLSGGVVTVSGRDYSLTGEAATPAAYAASQEAVKNLTSSYAPVSIAVRAPEVSPFEWTATRDGNAVTLTGLAASDGARARIAAAAKAALPGVAITDNTLVARGAPAGIEAATGFALAELSKLSTGTANIRDTALAVSGETATAADWKAAMAGLAAVPGGFTLVEDAVLAPMVDVAIWSATRAGNSVTLAGYVASPEQQTAIADAAKLALPGSEVIDKMQVARGTNGDLEAVASYGLGELARLSGGAVAVTGRDYSLTGEASTPAAFAESQAAVKDLTSSYAPVTIAVRAPEISPYLWTATRDGNAVTVTGMVASDSARVRIAVAAKAALPGVTVTDKTLVARGAPTGFEAMTSYGLTQLAHLKKGLFTASDNSLSIAGEAVDGANYDATMSALKSLPGGFGLVSEAVRLPVVKPYVFICYRAADQVTVAGSVPSSAARAAVLATAKATAPGGKVADTLVTAAGVPVGVDYAAATNFCLTGLSFLKAGTGTITDGAFSLAGDAVDAAAYTAVTHMLKGSLPGGLKLEAANITPPPAPAPKPTPPKPEPVKEDPPKAEPVKAEPVKEDPPKVDSAADPAVAEGAYAFDAVKEAGALTLTGSYPDAKVHDEILDMAKRRFFNEKLIDHLALRPGAPKNFAAAASAALNQLSRLATGKVNIANTNVSVSGEALYDKAAEDVNTNSKALLPAGFDVQASVTTQAVVTDLSAATCQEYLNGILKLGSIHFDSDSAAIKSESFGLLDALAATAARCPAAKIEIGGHTDGLGNADHNMDLSVRRAQAVATYLGKTGLALGALTPVGYGLSHPVAANDTEENRAKNRRIEFEIK